MRGERRKGQLSGSRASAKRRGDGSRNEKETSKLTGVEVLNEDRPFLLLLVLLDSLRVDLPLLDHPSPEFLRYQEPSQRLSFVVGRTQEGKGDASSRCLVSLD